MAYAELGRDSPEILRSADGSADAERRLALVLTSDPGMGVLRHVDAGYDDAIRCAEERGVQVPGLNY